MMENNTIICICSYNRPDFLIPLFNNLENQTDQDFTVILLNDGGNLKTKDRFEQSAFQFNYHYLETPKPSGLPRARNIVLDYIKGNQLEKDTTHVAFIDDDLLVRKDFSEKIKFYSEKYDGFCFRMIQKGESTTFDFTKYPILQKILTPLIGKIISFLGIIFGGFYIKTKKNKKIDHMVGCCLIYNFSKNKEKRFDLNLNEGNYVGEDTCFSYELKESGNNLYYISSYDFIHNSPPKGGCRIENRKERFFWYWKHKLYLVNKFRGKHIFFSSIFFCFFESIILSLFLRINLLKEYARAVKKINQLDNKKNES